MNKADAYHQTLHVSRNVVRHRYKTAVAYAEQVAHFVGWCQANPITGTNENRVTAYLDYVAPRIAASTQNVKLNALLFFFDKVLGKPLGDLGQWTYARRSKRLPVWLNPTETLRLLNLMHGIHQLMARVTYGSGLRLMECVRLRIQHIDLEQRTAFIIGAKGDKDRIVPLAQSVIADLAEHIQRVRALWEGDQANGLPPVALPDGLERKYPNYGRMWEWFWLWPARSTSRDPETGIVRRHHTHEDVYSRALKVAARKAGIGKRVTMHTLRHTFATHFLENGGDVHVLQKLMGHSHLETTSVYLHCLPKLISQASSPLDAIEASIVPFETAQPLRDLRALRG